jgi:hypothetical protein
MKSINHWNFCLTKKEVWCVRKKFTIPKGMDFFIRGISLDEIFRSLARLLVPFARSATNPCSFPRQKTCLLHFFQALEKKHQVEYRKLPAGLERHLTGQAVVILKF